MANTYVDAFTKTVDVNGTSFVYRETGQKNGIPLVLLHHLTAVLDDWDPRTIDSLAQKHRVIAFNNRVSEAPRAQHQTPSKIWQRMQLPSFEL
jgi:hypothetical protein